MNNAVKFKEMNFKLNITCIQKQYFFFSNLKINKNAEIFRFFKALIFIN